MITLFVKTGCPYCGKVLKTVEGLKIEIVQKNISDPKVVEELLALGGKRQVPYMVDDERGVSMYESNDIVKYLCEHYQGNAAEYDTDVPMHVCPID